MLLNLPCGCAKYSPLPKSLRIFQVLLCFLREGAFSSTSFSFFKTELLFWSRLHPDIFAALLHCGYELISLRFYRDSLGSFPHVICFSSWDNKETSSQKLICSAVPTCLPEKRRESLALAAFVCHGRMQAAIQSSCNTHCLGKQRRKLILVPLRLWTKT